jgi:hypothetical protein
LTDSITDADYDRIHGRIDPNDATSREDLEDRIDRFMEKAKSNSSSFRQALLDRFLSHIKQEVQTEPKIEDQAVQPPPGAVPPEERKYYDDIKERVVESRERVVVNVSARRIYEVIPWGKKGARAVVRFRSTGRIAKVKDAVRAIKRRLRL